MKRNGYLDKLKQHDAAIVRRSSLFAYKTFRDILIVTLDDFGEDKDRILDMLRAFRENLGEFSDLAVDDNKADKDMDYTKGKIDQRLKQILGDDFVPYEVRFKGI